MTKVIIGKDCGNSPKNIFIQDLTVAFAKRDVTDIADKVTEDVRWNIVGDMLRQGKDNVIEAVEFMKAETTEEISIHHVSTHGKAGAVDGVIKLENGEIHAFCDVYEFASVKADSVKEIISYVIKLK